MKLPTCLTRAILPFISTTQQFYSFLQYRVNKRDKKFIFQEFWYQCKQPKLFFNVLTVQENHRTRWLDGWDLSRLKQGLGFESLCMQMRAAGRALPPERGLPGSNPDQSMNPVRGIGLPGGKPKKKKNCPRNNLLSLMSVPLDRKTHIFGYEIMIKYLIIIKWSSWSMMRNIPQQ